MFWGKQEFQLHATAPVDFGAGSKKSDYHQIH